MSDYDKTNTGILFIHDKKGNDRAPDRKGSLNVDGVEYWVSGWIKDTSKGKALSLKITLKEGQQPNREGIRDQINPPAREERREPPQRREAFPPGLDDDEIGF